jgi:hypothetical protein
MSKENNQIRRRNRFIPLGGFHFSSKGFRQRNRTNGLLIRYFMAKSKENQFIATLLPIPSNTVK